MWKWKIFKELILTFLENVILTVLTCSSNNALRKRTRKNLVTLFTNVAFFFTRIRLSPNVRSPYGSHLSLFCCHRSGCLISREKVKHPPPPPPTQLNKLFYLNFLRILSFFINFLFSRVSSSRRITKPDMV